MRFQSLDLNWVTTMLTNTDIAVLKLIGEKTTTNFIPLSIDLPRRKSDWKGYGFPNAKDTPHFLNGKISLINQSTSDNIYGDIELSIDPECRLSDFSGFSGSPVMVDNQIIGIIKIQMDNAQNIGAISLFSIQEIISNSLHTTKNQHQPIFMGLGVKKLTNCRNTALSLFNNTKRKPSINKSKPNANKLA